MLCYCYTPLEVQRNVHALVELFAMMLLPLVKKVLHSSRFFPMSRSNGSVSLIACLICARRRWHIETPSIIEGSVLVMSKTGVGLAMFSMGDETTPSFVD